MRIFGGSQTIKCTKVCKGIGNVVNVTGIVFFGVVCGEGNIRKTGGIGGGLGGLVI